MKLVAMKQVITTFRQVYYTKLVFVTFMSIKYDYVFDAATETITTKEFMTAAGSQNKSMYNADDQRRFANPGDWWSGRDRFPDSNNRQQAPVVNHVSQWRTDNSRPANGAPNTVNGQILQTK